MHKLTNGEWFVVCFMLGFCLPVGLLLYLYFRDREVER
jgi:hypothetical protein